ncbi:hypothetical protein F383_32964 [Gossypium arboreum]|uniref:Uncharacterized protein n=1 Tax=Gossypium arboreum TaxID=29729 RepID=A0A0B0N3N4_GOSAR|nr:hypothetical protein F383_32964 [Gossypium arboreum]
MWVLVGDLVIGFKGNG